MTRYLCIDTELTSFSESNNLITSYLGIIENDNLIDELDLKLIPNDGFFIVDPESMGINNIDLREWKGIRYKDAKSLVDKFISKYVFDEKRNPIGQRLQPIGQAVSGDIKKIQSCLISEARWNESVRRIPLDSLQLAASLRNKGKLKLESINLTALAEYFKLDSSGAHDARFDALLSYRVYMKLEEMI